MNIKNKIVLISLVIFFFIITICFSILKQNFIFSSIQYNSSLTNNVYISYKYKFIFNKLKNKIFLNNIKNRDERLPIVEIFIAENHLDYFNKYAPDSNKEWKKAMLINQNNQAIKVKISPRGDNPDNWSYNKKSWKIKYSKNNFPNNIREFTYILPATSEEVFGLKFYTSFVLSKMYGLPTPNFRYVELHINGENKGFYYEIEKIDESFLRNNKLMPINIYKGENYYLEEKIRLDKKLFTNPALWKKISFFNLSHKEDKSDLANYLKQIILFENRQINSEQFFSYFPLDIWAKFILSGSSVHGDNIHNQRIAIDPWSGWALPIINDPDYGSSLLINNISLSGESLDRLDRVMHLDPYFIYKKYLLYDEFIFKKKNN